MSDHADNRKYLEVIEEATEGAPGSISDDMVLTALEGWDSLAVVSLMALVDERFEVLLAPEAIRRCTTVADLVALLKAP